MAKTLHQSQAEAAKDGNFMDGLPRNVMPLTRVLLEVKHVVPITASTTKKSSSSFHGHQVSILSCQRPIMRTKLSENRKL